MSYSFTLQPDPTPASSSSSTALASTSTSAFAAFLGFGLLRPLQRDLKSDFASSGGETLVRSCVGQILGTMAGSDYVQGELPWRPEFGSLLYLLSHRKGVMLTEFAKAWALEALRRWEPRVSVTNIHVTFDRTLRLLTISLMYDIIDRNVVGNNVVIPNVSQTVKATISG